MARGIYPHELHDADIQWLLNNFYEQDQTYVMVTEPTLPITLIRVNEPNSNPMNDENVKEFFASAEELSNLEFLKRKPTV